jgi:hypothetical protein
MDAVTPIISKINEFLTPEDDPLFWAIATYTLLGDMFLFLTREPQKHEIFVQFGACSHWLRPHQTRLSLAGGFALPVGYDDSGSSRRGLPEYDWEIKLHYNYTINEWVLVDKFFGKTKLIRRFTLPTRTLRHNQAAIHSIWTPGTPRKPREKRIEYFGFRKMNGTWKCVFPSNVGA